MQMRENTVLFTATEFSNILNQLDDMDSIRALEIATYDVTYSTNCEINQSELAELNDFTADYKSLFHSIHGAISLPI